VRVEFARLSPTVVLASLSPSLCCQRRRSVARTWSHVLRVNVGNDGLGCFFCYRQGSVFAVPLSEKHSRAINGLFHLEPDGETKMQELETTSARRSSIGSSISWRVRVSAVLGCAIAGFVIGYVGATFGYSAQTTGAMILLAAGIPVLGSLRMARMMHRKWSQSFRTERVPGRSESWKNCGGTAVTRSVLGQKQTFEFWPAMSALPPIADMATTARVDHQVKASSRFLTNLIPLLT
jgi:hypothetical protein